MDRNKTPQNRRWPAPLLAGLAVIATIYGCSRQSFVRDFSATEAIIDGATDLGFVDGLRVETLDGVVTLSGVVQNLTIKEDLERIAMRVNGVRKVVNRLEVDPEPRPDMEIKEAVLTALRTDPATYGYPINVLVAAGVVTLSGEVQFVAQRLLAQEVVTDISGIIAIVNGIDAVKSTQALSDENRTLRRQILSALESTGLDIALAKAQGREETDVGFAAFRSEQGDLGDRPLTVTWWLREKPQQADAAFAGVVQQDSRELQRAIYSRIADNPRLLPFVVHVGVEQHQVLLSGTVSNFPAKRAAEQEALAVVGERLQVLNQIRVRPERRVSDPALQQALHQVIAKDQVLKPYDVSVRAFDGVVYLTGEVSNEAVRERAEQLAGRTVGVTDVRSHLILTGTISLAGTSASSR